MPSIRRDWRDRPSLIHRNTRTTWWMRDGRIITPGQFFGQLIHIPRITLISDPFSDEHPVRLHRQQFPVRLGYAVTFSKSVGQTLQRAGITSRPLAGVMACCMARCQELAIPMRSGSLSDNDLQDDDKVSAT